MYRFAALIYLLLIPCATFGEEQICRYCQDDSRLRSMLADGDSSSRFHYAPDRQVDVIHIKLDVVPNFEDHTVNGTASITARVIQRPVDVLRLDAINLRVSEVRSDGATVEDFVSSREDLQIAFTRPLPTGTEFTVHVDYSAEPIKGLYFRTPEMGYPKTDTHVWTQGETHEAPHWFPCFDYPNERSSTEVICHVPKGMTVLSNGRRMEESTDAHGLKTVRWLQEKPHVNYLLCLVAGNLEKLEKHHREVALGFYTQPSLAQYAANSFADTEQIMAFFEREIGIPFPWVKYDQVTIRDFTAGGMENTTLTTLTHNTIFSKATENLKTTRRLDAHEMAHQWFGDFVTCKDWSHLWLNEGFATFYTHLYEGHKFGRDAMLYGLLRDADGILRRGTDKRPIVFHGYKSPKEQFDYRSYPKGSWVLHMLRSQLGEDVYRECIQEYLEQHALTSVVTDDLRQVIEKRTGRTMDRFFDQWLYHGRFPDLKISYKWDAKSNLAKVSIRQTQKVDDDVLLFEIPTKLRFHVDGELKDHDVVVRKQEQDFYVPLSSKPSIVRFDPEFTVLAKILFDKTDDLLLAQLKNEEDTIGRVLAARALGSRKTKNTLAALQDRLNNDAFFGVRIAAAKAIAKHGSDEAYKALEDQLDQPNARVREEVVRPLVNRFHSDTPALIQRILKNESNPRIQSHAIRALGRFHSKRTRRAIQRFLKSQSFRNELAVAAINAIQQLNDPWFKKVLLQSLQEREAEFTTRGFSTGLTVLAQISKNEKRKSDVRDYLLEHVNHPKRNIRVAALNGLGTLGDVKASSVLESFVDSPEEQIAQAAKAALNRIREVKPTAPQEVIQLRKDLADLKKSNDKLRKGLDELRRQFESKAETSSDEKDEGKP